MTRGRFRRNLAPSDRRGWPAGRPADGQTFHAAGLDNIRHPCSVIAGQRCAWRAADATRTFPLTDSCEVAAVDGTHRSVTALTRARPGPD
jgi:hypothetical protein